GIEAIPDGIPTKDAFNVLVAKFPKESGAQSTAQVVIPGAATDPTISSQIQALDAAVASNRGIERLDLRRDRWVGRGPGDHDLGGRLRPALLRELRDEDVERVLRRDPVGDRLDP